MRRTAMKNATESSPQLLRYFDMLANIGVTKHVGSLKATEELASLTEIGASSYVLDVGSGVGLTPIYLARNYGSRVMGIDITPRMIDRSKEEARRQQIEDRVEFRIADAQELPFEDNLFDAVIAESVNAFVPDRPKAFSEYVRVTKPGGYVGINEPTWLERPSPDALAYMASLGAHVLHAEEWEMLLVGAGAQDIVVRVYKADAREDAKGRIKRYGIRGVIRGTLRTMFVFLSNASDRATLKLAVSDAPSQIAETLGYGIYVGRKEQ